MGIKVLSLFDGISCGMVALERAGLEVDRYVAYEIEESAIKISNYNYPQIEHKGDVFKAEYKENEFDLLIGGSPCTYWSIARGDKTTREVKANGIGWELFNQYARALKTIKPKYFLYENNYSMAKEIKQEITDVLGVEPIMINSNLVSAQNRKRYYWTNIPGITQPKDRNIELKDILTNDRDWRNVGKWVYKVWGKKRKIDTLYEISAKKSNTLTTLKNHSRNYYLDKSHENYTNLNAIEWERLQTLPDNYTDCVNQSARHKGIGNGWTVDVIAHILSFIPKEDLK
jgi:site-specific DNA-cytosine methylase